MSNEDDSSEAETAPQPTRKDLIAAQERLRELRNDLAQAGKDPERKAACQTAVDRAWERVRQIEDQLFPSSSASNAS